MSPEASVVRSQLYQAIEQPGALICVKTSRHRDTIYLIANEIIKEHTPKDYEAVGVNFQWANAALTNSDQLWQWFCTKITRKLKLKNTLPESWEGVTPSNNCSNYFETYLLPKIPTALVLVLYNVEWILEHQAIANDFVRLLVFWHNNAANNDSWKKLRLVIVHSQDIRTNREFNVGFVIDFPEAETGQ
ncbi:AAA-like domain-containing protein [Microcoleus sp. S28C3]|uniref:AAA-like domain-containing protein n=1 Tax=Microcoleus sp. S28C3 TaxID=3055414 RepID=UPI002FD3099A